MQTEEEMLSAEIEFWRDMIESRKGTVPEQTTERMLNARELAERRLLMMQEEPADSATNIATPPRLCQSG